jgi:hypothetical protein
LIGFWLEIYQMGHMDLESIQATLPENLQIVQELGFWSQVLAAKYTIRRAGNCISGYRM